MSDFLQFSFNGISTGAIYALVGVGLTLGIGIARFFNFAQGQLVVLAAFVQWALMDVGLAYLLALPVTVAAVGVLGIGIRNGVSRFADNDTLITFLATLGIGIVIQYAIVLVWGPDPKTLIGPFDGQVRIGGVVLAEGKLMLLAVAAPAVALLYAFLARSEEGRRLRSCAENVDVSALLGINVQRSMWLAVGIGSGLAALAGVLIGTIFPFNAFAGATYLTKGIAVALAGGLGSVTGAVVCGVGLGLIETYASAYGVNLGFYSFDASWEDGYAFVLMIGMLALRPRGLFRGTGAI